MGTGTCGKGATARVSSGASAASSLHQDGSNIANKCFCCGKFGHITTSCRKKEVDGEAGRSDAASRSRGGLLQGLPERCLRGPSAHLCPWLAGRRLRGGLRNSGLQSPSVYAHHEEFRECGYPLTIRWRLVSSNLAVQTQLWTQALGAAHGATPIRKMYNLIRHMDSTSGVCGDEVRN